MTTATDPLEALDVRVTDLRAHLDRLDREHGEAWGELRDERVRYLIDGGSVTLTGKLQVRLAKIATERGEVEAALALEDGVRRSLVRELQARLYDEAEATRARIRTEYVAGLDAVAAALTAMETANAALQALVDEDIAAATDMHDADRRGELGRLDDGRPLRGPAGPYVPRLWAEFMAGWRWRLEDSAAMTLDPVKSDRIDARRHHQVIAERERDEAQKAAELASMDQYRTVTLGLPPR